MNTNGEEVHGIEPTIGRTVALDVLDSPKNRAPMMGRTRTARWRTAVLVFVHVLMIAHVIQWIIVGSTVSPVEPSESMETIEVGVINAGAIMFAVALLATALFGRFFCGWICHMVALQDLCAYWMTSLGIRPKPFRSRLLIFVPLAMGFYMFLWPTTKKFIIGPAIDAVGMDWPAWLKPVHPIQRWENGLVVEDFWATFPDWYIAVPFLLICGFATVYFLGAKGLCTYACPYGGFFAPIDKVSPLRIRVNDDCHQCGYCTSVCTSNVRVNEEVRDYGMVIDQGCMKTLDCVSACPNDALSLGFGKTAIGAKTRNEEGSKAAKGKRNRRYDLTMMEEISAAIIFVYLFLATRGMLDQVPMLLAGGLAICGTMMAMTTWWILTRQHARLYGIHLKMKGKIKPAGFIVLVLMAAFALTSVWAAHARFARWRGDVLFAGSELPAGLLLRPEFNPSDEQRERAQAAEQWLQRGDSFANGGYGWSLNAKYRLRRSYFLLMLKREAEAAEALLEVIEKGNPTDNLVGQAEQLMNRAGASHEEVDAMKERALELHPNLHQVRAQIAMHTAQKSGLEAAEKYWNDPDAPSDEPGYIITMMKYYAEIGDTDKMLSFYEQAVEAAREDRNTSGWFVELAGLVGRFRFHDRMTTLLDEAVEHDSATPGAVVTAAEFYYNALEDREKALALIEQGLSMRGAEQLAVQKSAASMLITLGETDRGVDMLVDAANDSDSPFDAIAIGQGLIRASMGLGERSMMEKGIALIAEQVDKHPDLVILRHDYASFLAMTGDPEQGAEQMSKAAELESGNAIFADRASQMWSRAGDEQKSARWREEAARRYETASP